MIRTIVVALFIALTSATCWADCHNLYRPHYVQKAVVQQVVLYSVGNELVIEAAVEKALLRREALQAQRPQQQAVSTSALNARCLRCHNGTRDDTDFDLRAPITDYYSTRTTEILSGINVPEKMKGVIASLKQGDHGDITQEVLTRWRAERTKAPVRQIPVPAVPPEPEQPGVLR